jgi:hypothetical protein
MDFILFKHKETGGEFQAPDEEGVREFYEARGWEEVEPPEPMPFVPEKVNIDPSTVPDEWITLYHPETTALHDFPNNLEAIAGAQESGWELPPKVTPDESPAPSEDTESPAPKPDSKPKAKAPAKAAETEEK